MTMNTNAAASTCCVEYGCDLTNLCPKDNSNLIFWPFLIQPTELLHNLVMISKNQLTVTISFLYILSSYYTIQVILIITGIDSDWSLGIPGRDCIL